MNRCVASSLMSVAFPVNAMLFKSAKYRHIFPNIIDNFSPVDTFSRVEGVAKVTITSLPFPSRFNLFVIPVTSTKRLVPLFVISKYGIFSGFIDTGSAE